MFIKSIYLCQYPVILPAQHLPLYHGSPSVILLPSLLHPYCVHALVLLPSQLLSAILYASPHLINCFVLVIRNRNTYPLICLYLVTQNCVSDCKLEKFSSEKQTFGDYTP